MFDLVELIAKGLSEYHFMVGINNNGTFFIVNSELEKQQIIAVLKDY